MPALQHHHRRRRHDDLKSVSHSQQAGLPGICLRATAWNRTIDLRKADAIEIVVGQGAKPGGGGMLLGQKISDRVAEMRTLPKPASISAPPVVIRTGPARMISRNQDSGTARDHRTGEKPIYVKIGGNADPILMSTLAVKAGADVVVLDGMQGRHGGHPGRVYRTCGTFRRWRVVRPRGGRRCRDLDVHREVQLVRFGRHPYRC